MHPRQTRNRAFSLALDSLSDLVFGAALAMLRAAVDLSDSQAVRTCARIAWRTLRVAALVALLVCAAVGAGWLCRG